MNEQRSRREYTTQSIVVSFARQGVAIDTMSRALVTPEPVVVQHCRRAVEDGLIVAMPPMTVFDRRGAMQVEIANLRDQLDTAQQLIRELTERRETSTADMIGVARMTVTEAKIAATFIEYGRASKDRLYQNLYGAWHNQDQPEPKIIDVLVCKLRKKLAVHGIGIKTIWGHGYEMDAENVAKLKSLVLPEVESPPLQVTQNEMVA